MDGGAVVGLVVIGGLALAALADHVRVRGEHRAEAWRVAWQASGREATLPKSGPPLGYPTGCLIREGRDGPLIATVLLGQLPSYEPHPQAPAVRRLLDTPRQVRNGTTGELAPVAGTPAQPDWFYWWLCDALRLNRGALRGAHEPAPQWLYPDWPTTPDAERDHRAW